MFVVFFLILIFAVGGIFVGIIGTAFADVGFSEGMVALILIGTFMGSFFNIPILRLKAVVPIIRDEFASFFGMIYRIPQVEYSEKTTMVAINVGGALIPVIVSVYLLWKQPSAAFYALIGVAVVALVTHLTARPVKGVGIVTPAFLPPIIAGISAYFLYPDAPQIVAYLAGVLGTLIGADLSNLHIIPMIGTSSKHR